MSVPIDDLFALARTQMDRAYAPYSRFHVGAALLTGDGRVYAGCNVENAAYPQGWCAEASAIAAMIADGSRSISAILVAGAAADGSGGYKDDVALLCTPCGGCRQKIREFGGPETAIHVCGPEGLKRSFTLGELLPYDFGPHNLGG
jgi:cytidine deaminase